MRESRQPLNHWIPAFAGMTNLSGGSWLSTLPLNHWIPAFAGMTNRVVFDLKK
jgi:hypothetical protein